MGDRIHRVQTGTNSIKDQSITVDITEVPLTNRFVSYVALVSELLDCQCLDMIIVYLTIRYSRLIHRITVKMDICNAKLVRTHGAVQCNTIAQVSLVPLGQSDNFLLTSCPRPWLSFITQEQSTTHVDKRVLSPFCGASAQVQDGLSLRAVM